MAQHKNNRGHGQPDQKGDAQQAAKDPGQFALVVLRQCARRLLRKNRLQSHGRDAHERHNLQQRRENRVFLLADVLGHRVDGIHEGAAGHRRHHHPAALPKKCRAMFRSRHGRVFHFFSRHESWMARGWFRSRK